MPRFAARARMNPIHDFLSCIIASLRTPLLMSGTGRLIKSNQPGRCSRALTRQGAVIGWDAGIGAFLTGNSGGPHLHHLGGVCAFGRVEVL